MTTLPFANLKGVAEYLRTTLKSKKYVLLYAYNGIGKTRLSAEFKNLGKKVNEEGEIVQEDTLYFNAFTEDLFSWDNDLENDTHRVLRINGDSRFFKGLQKFEMESRIGKLLKRYADFKHRINYENREILFFRERDVEGNRIPIKVSRGEENIFVWCFFLAVVRLAIEGQGDYDWVKYIYIDDPISSLDDNNAVAVAHHLAQLFKKSDAEKSEAEKSKAEKSKAEKSKAEKKVVLPPDKKVVLSSHHTLFFNVMCNEWKNANKYFLSKSERGDGYSLKAMEGDTARFYHVAMLRYLKKAADSEELFTYHFNILRSIMEKAALFHGYVDFSHCIKVDAENDDKEKTFLKRLIQLLNHGGYSLMEPVEMLPENKAHFKKILNDFLETYSFNQKIFSDIDTTAAVD